MGYQLRALDVMLDGGVPKICELLGQRDLIQCAEKKPQSLKASRRIKGRPFVRLQIADKRVHRRTGANRNPIRLSIRKPDRLASELHDVPDFGEFVEKIEVLSSGALRHPANLGIGLCSDAD